MQTLSAVPSGIVGVRVHGELVRRRAVPALLAMASAALCAAAAPSSAAEPRDLCAPTTPRHTCPGEPDFEPPETKFLLLPPERTRSRWTTVQFLATERSTFTCALDDRKPFPCTSPMTFRVTRGRHTLEVTATDEAGNVDTTPASATWLVKKRR
jgi:hypothetical protein